ncbi:MAG: DUF2194 domain-containing protein [Lachnospiraceae bacterium]|nr:DUF2194 domain-containing protein [Lachnospiraceae bacterium]
MVSRRKYFVIFLMMAVLLFLFQFSQVMRENWNYYTHNEYADADLPGADMAWTQEKMSAGRVQGTVLNVFYIGPQDTEVSAVAKQWCRYAKYQLTYYDALPRFSTSRMIPTMIFIDAEHVDAEDYLYLIDAYQKRDAAVVFLTLPTVEKIQATPRLQELLGIEDIPKEKVRVDGIRLFDGCLLGGEAIYQAQNEKEAKELQDLELTMPWYVTGKASKTYMIGMMNEKVYEREKFPRIIWRNSMGDSMVFAVNGDYMKDETGLGFLDLFMYEMSDYVLYPVVNAQSTLMVDYPDFSGADEEAVTALYSRSAQSIQQDIFWPSIYSMITRNELKPTCFFMTQYDAEAVPEASADQVDFYLRQLNEVGAEAGRSMNYGENMTLADKVTEDNLFYRDRECAYNFNAGYLENVKDITPQEWEKAGWSTNLSTIAGDAGENGLLSYYTDSVTLQDVTHDAAVYSYAENLRLRSILTAIGYSNMRVDFHRVLWPQGKEDSWENYFDKVYSNISTYWSRLVIYDQTTLSQSDARARAFLDLDFKQLRSDDLNLITLFIQNDTEDCYFLLRTHGEAIDQIQGGTYRMLEKDAYLIHVQDSHVLIHMEQAEAVLHYSGPFGK